MYVYTDDASGLIYSDCVRRGADSSGSRYLPMLYMSY